MVHGRTVLFWKSSMKENAVDNFRPFLCVRILRKLFTGIIFESIYTFLENEKILPEKRKGCRQKSSGREYSLLTDKCILRNGKRRHIHLTMVDYKKAYDMASHLSWSAWNCLER